MNVIRIFIRNGYGFGSSTQIRCSHFIKNHDGESLWKSVRAETGKVGGRGKRTKKRKAVDLGAGKILGEGKAGILWPGLNVPVDKAISQRTEEEQKRWEESRSQRSTKIQRNKDNSNRGWSGGLWGGQKLISGDSESAASNFDAYLLQAARVSHMIASVGRVYSIRALVVVGNGNGTFGVGMHSSHDVPNAARKARIKALKRLQFIDRYEDRTVFEDMYVNHHRTFMHIRQQPEGYGLRCHRVVSTMCNVIGIKDLYVRTYGATTPLSVVKCFVKSLHTQETHQQKADRLGYHVVQFDPLRDNFPQVLASPKNGTKEEPYNEYLEYLRQPLITRDVKKREGYCQHQWTDVLYQTNQGPPIPNPVNIPAKFRDVRNSQLD